MGACLWHCNKETYIVRERVMSSCMTRNDEEDHMISYTLFINKGQKKGPGFPSNLDSF